MGTLKRKRKGLKIIHRLTLINKIFIFKKSLKKIQKWKKRMRIKKEILLQIPNLIWNCLLNHQMTNDKLRKKKILNMIFLNFFKNF